MKKIWIILAILIVIAATAIAWWYYTYYIPHILSESRINASVTINAPYDVRVLNVSYNSQMFIINSLIPRENFNGSSIAYSALKSIKLADEVNTNFKGFNKITATVENSSDRSIVNSRVVLMWKESAVVVITAKSNIDDINYVSGWFVDNYE
jgi:hypothetical protein